MKTNKILFASILSCLVLSSLAGCGKKYDDYVNEDYVGQGIISSDVDSTAASNGSTNRSYEITKQLSYSAAVDSDIISAVKNKDEQLFVLDANNDNVSIDMSTDNHIIGLISQSNKSKDSKAKVVLKTDADGNILMLDNDGNIVSVDRAVFYSMYVPTIMADNTEDTTEQSTTENSSDLITKEEDITGKFIVDVDKTVVTIDNNTYVEDIPMNIDNKTTSSDDIVVAIIDSIKNTESNYVTDYNSSLSETINNLANEVVDSSDPRVVNVTVNDDGSKTLEVVISTDVLVIEDDSIKVDTVETTVVITVPADDTTSKTTEKSTDTSEKTTDESKTTSKEETTRPTESSSTSESKTDESKLVETDEVETDDSTPATEHRSYYEDLPDQEAPEREYEAGEEVDWEKSDPGYTQEKILPDGDPYTVEE